MSQLTKNTTDLDALIAKANALPDAGTSEDLTAVLDAQETLISELEAELEGKAAGGGGASVETCTVIFDDSDSGLLSNAYVTTYNDGMITTSSITELGVLSPLALNNVVCGSGIVIPTVSGTPESIYALTNMTMIYFSSIGNMFAVIQAPIQSGEGKLKIEL